jgi:hypothetical protein
MQPKMIKLADGREVEAQIIASDEVDFHALTWTFRLSGDERVGAGDYYVIAAADMEGRSRMGKHDE